MTAALVASALPEAWPGDMGHLRVLVANGKLQHQAKAKANARACERGEDDNGYRLPRFLWVSPGVWRRLLLEDATRVHGLIVVPLASLTGGQVAISDRRPTPDGGAPA